MQKQSNEEFPNMNRKSTKKPLMTGSIVLLLLIIVSAIFAFLNSRNHSSSIVQEGTVLHSSEYPSKDSHPASTSYSRSTSNVMEDNKSLETFRETAISHKNDTGINTYTASPGNTYEQKKISGKESERYESMQDAGSIVSADSPEIEKTDQGDPDTPVDRGTWKYDDRNYSLPSEEGDDESPDQEDDLEEEEPANQRIAVSRGLVSGSMNEGVMSITIFVLADNTITGALLIKETIPRGWDVVESTLWYDNFDYQSGKITWMFQGDNVVSRIIKYNIKKIEDVNRGKIFHGQFYYNDIGGKADGGDITGFNGQ